MATHGEMNEYYGNETKTTETEYNPCKHARSMVKIHKNASVFQGLLLSAILYVTYYLITTSIQVPLLALWDVGLSMYIFTIFVDALYSWESAKHKLDIAEFNSL